MSHMTLETTSNGTTRVPVDGYLTEFGSLGSAGATAIDETAVICHELRNSLAVVRGAARLLRSPVETDRVDTARSLIERHVDQMSRHVADLLDPLRRTGRSLRLHLSQVDLREIARNAVDAIGPETTLRRHRLAVTLPEAPLWAHVDGERFEQVLANLLINAAKYTPDGGDVALTMERVGDRAVLRVRDSGVGIEPALLSRVFGMFMQVEQAPNSNEVGSGIGLAVVKSLVELHGGSVTAASAGVGTGSEFTIVLPVL